MVVVGIDRRHARALGALAVRHDVERGEAHDDLQPGRRGANAVDDLAHEARAVLEAAAERPGPLVRAEQLVAEIAVAVLDVDEAKARVGRQLRGGDEVVDQPAQLVVAQDRGPVTANRGSSTGLATAASGSGRSCRFGFEKRPECVSCRPT